MWPFLGPAFIAAVAYVDPGTSRPTSPAGSEFGYQLLWVILAANLMAMLIQTMSAKLGIATGHEPARCAASGSAPRRLTIALWVQAELIAMATDLAEFIGAALGLNLLFGVPLFAAGVITGIFAFAILALQTMGGFRHLEAAIVCLVGVIVAGSRSRSCCRRVGERGGARAAGAQLLGLGERALAAGILGATVMPHVIYLHSALTQRRVVGRTDGERLAIFRFERVDVVIAMTIAGLVNMSMLIMAAGVFHANGLTDLDQDEVYAPLGSILGQHADIAVRDRAARLGTLLVVGGDSGRASGDAGVHRPPDPAVRAPRASRWRPRWWCSRSVSIPRRRS